MDDLTKNYIKIKNLSFSLGIVFVLVETVYYYYQETIVFTKNNLGNEASEILNKFLLFMIDTGVFDTIFYPKIVILFFASVFLFDNKKKVKKKYNSKQRVLFLLIFTGLLFNSVFLLDFLNVFGTYAPLSYFSINIFFFLSIVKQFKNIDTSFGRSRGKDDKKDLKNKIFKQCEKQIQNDLSVNIPYQFVKKYSNKLKPKLQTGWINVVEPRRATIIMGKPGSGKSYSFNEEFIRQHIMKGFSFINYDYKFPTLTEIAYNYVSAYGDIYKKKYGKGLNFCVINIDEPQYSHRCNPIRADLINKQSEAVDAIHSIFFNIDKKSTQKPDFFLNSAMSLVTAAFWFLKIYENGTYLSLPHLIEFIQNPDEKIIKILCDYDEVLNFIAAFKDAHEKKAYDQLAGMTASARIPLGKLVSNEMYWVMTEGEEGGVDLRVNRKENPTILNIANNPETQKSNAPALGLYMSQAVKVINKQGRIPCNFHVDELPTIYINGLDNLIATGRSNNICTTLAFQDYTQLVRDYGKEIADAIFDTCGNVFCGTVNPDTGRKIKEMIGKAEFERINETVAADGKVNHSYNKSTDYIVYESDLMQLNQGEFVGVLAENFKNPLDIKIFKGMVSPDKSDLKNEKLSIIDDKATPENMKTHRKEIQTQIKQLIEKELSRIDAESGGFSE